MPAKHTRNRRRKRRRRALVCLLALVLLLGGVAAGWHYRANFRQWLVPSAPAESSSLGAPAGATTTQPSTTTQPPSTTTQPLPAKYVLTDVPVIAQYPNYPTGCESVSAVIAMRYAGSDISIDDFIDKYLQKISICKRATSTPKTALPTVPTPAPTLWALPAAKIPTAVWHQSSKTP